MFKAQKGQTLIETALILFLLLLILLGISEFARAWYTKNSLKNAVRHGARIAVVTPAATSTVCPIANQKVRCDQSRTFTPCPGSGIVNSVCTSPGISPSGNPGVSICYKEEPSGQSGLDAGDTINVCGQITFGYIVGGSPWPWPKTTVIYTDASMRYE